MKLMQSNKSPQSARANTLSFEAARALVAFRLAMSPVRPRLIALGRESWPFVAKEMLPFLRGARLRGGGMIQNENQTYCSFRRRYLVGRQRPAGAALIRADVDCSIFVTRNMDPATRDLSEGQRSSRVSVYR